jgi:hypothetical protein
MATTAKTVKDERRPKYGIRELALRGEVAGVIKSSW